MEPQNSSFFDNAAILLLPGLISLVELIKDTLKCCYHTTLSILATLATSYLDINVY